MTGNGGNRLDRIERLLEQTVRASKEAERTSKQAHARLDADLRKWVKSSVKEALSHRKRMREIDDKITQLAAAQLVTEEKLQRFISSAGRGRKVIQSNPLLSQPTTLSKNRHDCSAQASQR